MLQVREVKANQSEWAEQIYGLRRDEAFCDITFICHDTSFKAHRVVLAACSPVWHDIFSQDSDLTSGELDCEPEAFSCVLDYCYSGKLHHVNPPILLIDVHLIAHQYEIKALQDMCEALMKSEIVLENVLEYYAYACKYAYRGSSSGLSTLRDACGKFICTNFQAVVEGDKFLELTSSQVQGVFQLDSLHIQEDVVLTAALRWLHHAEDRKPMAKLIFEHVRLPLLSKPVLLNLHERWSDLLDVCPSLEALHVEALRWQLSEGKLSNVQTATSPHHSTNPRRFTQRHENALAHFVPAEHKLVIIYVYIYIYIFELNVFIN